MEKRVQNKFNVYPDHIRQKMEKLRELIIEVAANTEGVGELEETLKWSEPAYLPSKTKSGTTVRIDWKAKKPNQIGLYVSCNTNLVDTYRQRFQNQLKFEGNRAIILPADEPIPEKELKICVQMAFRYQLDKK